MAGKSGYNQRKNEYTQQYIRENYRQLSIRLPKDGGYAVYCRREEGKLRTVCGNLASWTGITPKWCPLRQRMEGTLCEKG